MYLHMQLLHVPNSVNSVELSWKEGSLKAVPFKHQNKDAVAWKPKKQN